jgi:hypothetical protein
MVLTAPPPLVEPLQGGLEKQDQLVKHLQLNNNLYCSHQGTVGGNVMVCMEGYVQSLQQDVKTPGSPTRDHLMLKLLHKVGT